MQKILLTLLTALLVGLFISLGTWQLHRAQFKRELESQFQTDPFLKPIPISKLSRDLKRDRYRLLKVSGEFDNEHQLLVDNRFYQHQLGFDVYTPMKLSSGKILLINRGWISRGRHRDLLPAIKKINGKQPLTGMLQPIPASGYTLSDQQPTRWPRVIENLSMKTINTALPTQNILPFALVLDKKSPHTLTYNFTPTTMSSSRHYGYMVQWYALAMTLLIIYLVLSVRNRKNYRHSRR